MWTSDQLLKRLKQMKEMLLLCFGTIGKSLEMISEFCKALSSSTEPEV
jgi:hypothetical protein